MIGLALLVLLACYLFGISLVAVAKFAVIVLLVALALDALMGFRLYSVFRRRGPRG